MKGFFTLIFLAASGIAAAQSTFKAGWYNYNTGYITHEYNYRYAFKDSIQLTFSDSTVTYTSTDSTVIMTISYPAHDPNVYKTVNYLNAKKLLLKTEDYKNDNLTQYEEWKYDDKGFREMYVKDNKVSGQNYRDLFSHTSDKKTGETIVLGTSYVNGRIEFYTRTYYDRKNVKIKEIRLNDNNKDVVHIESFFYGNNGKLKERSVYFPEWHVTKKFEEKEGGELPKCYKTLPVGIPDKATIAGRMYYMKKVLNKNQGVIFNPECQDFEYKFRNFSNCEIEYVSTGVNNGRKVVCRFREKP